MLQAGRTKYALHGWYFRDTFGGQHTFCFRGDATETDGATEYVISYTVDTAGQSYFTRALTASAAEQGNLLPITSGAVYAELVRMQKEIDNEIAALAAAKADRPSYKSAVLPPEISRLWKSDNAVPGYPVYYDKTDGEVLETDHLELHLLPVSMEIARECGLYPFYETMNGAIRFRAQRAPSDAVIQLEYSIVR